MLALFCEANAIPATDRPAGTSLHHPHRRLPSQWLSKEPTAEHAGLVRHNPTMPAWKTSIHPAGRIRSPTCRFLTTCYEPLDRSVLNRLVR